MGHLKKEEFEIRTDFNNWLNILPYLKNYKRHTYFDKEGFLIGYFKLNK